MIASIGCDAKRRCGRGATGKNVIEVRSIEGVPPAPGRKKDKVNGHRLLNEQCDDALT